MRARFLRVCQTSLIIDIKAFDSLRLLARQLSAILLTISIRKPMKQKPF